MKQINLNKRSFIASIIKLILFSTFLIFYNCENQDNPSGISEKQWIVDSTLIPEIISQVDSNNIRNTIQTLQDFETRYAYSPKCYEAAQWIKSQLESYGYVVEDQSFQRYLFYDIFFADELNAWIVGEYGLILHSGDGGAIWQKQESSTYIHLRKVFFIDEYNGWAGGDFILLKTSNGGQSWQTVEGISGDKVYDIFFLNESVGWICTNTALYHTTDGGNAWSIMYSEESHNVYFLTDSIGFLCLTKSLQKTIDAGSTWNEVFTILGTWDSLWDIDFYNNQIGMVVSDDGDVFLSKDAGNNWVGQKLSDGANIYGCIVVNSDFYIVRLLASFHKTYDGGNTWELFMPDDPHEFIMSIDFKNDQEGFIAGISIFKESNDSGKTWSEIPSNGMVDEVLLHNIKGTKRGRINGSQKIIICAHYDSDSSNPMVEAPGADDNASGTSAVLEMARIMSDYDFDYTVQFIFFGAEELGSVGSRYAARESNGLGEDILQVYNFDMVGYCPDDVFDIQIHAPSKATRQELIINGSKYADMIIYEKDQYLSDEKEYTLTGYPAVGISEYTYSSLRDYPWYHSVNDRLDKLNIRFTAEVTRFTLGGICLKALPIIPK